MKREYMISLLLFVVLLMLLWACQFLESTKVSYNELLLTQRELDANIDVLNKQLVELQSQVVEITPKMMWAYENRKEFDE